MLPITLSLPLSVRVSEKKKFILNLNQYRNTHFRVLAKAKENYEALVASILLPYVGIEIKEPVVFTYILWYKSKQDLDISNILCIVDKFVSDAIVKADILVDDNYHVIREIKYMYGGVDTANPRADLVISSWPG